MRLRTRRVALPLLLASIAIGPALAREDEESSRASISPDARTVLVPVENLHRRHPTGLAPSDFRRVLEMERCAGRIKVLIGHALGSTSERRRAESLSLLRAEHARWDQLRARVEGDGLTRRDSDSRERTLLERIRALSAVIDREISQTEEISAIQEEGERGRRTRAAIHRLRQGDRHWQRPRGHREADVLP